MDSFEVTDRSNSMVGLKGFVHKEMPKLFSGQEKNHSFLQVTNSKIKEHTVSTKSRPIRDGCLIAHFMQKVAGLDILETGRRLGDRFCKLRHLHLKEMTQTRIQTSRTALDPSDNFHKHVAFRGIFLHHSCRQI